jgi:hypothetical protein
MNFLVVVSAKLEVIQYTITTGTNLLYCFTTLFVHLPDPAPIPLQIVKDRCA